MRYWLFIFAFLVAGAAQAEKCSTQDLNALSNPAIDSDERGDLASCFIHTQMQNPEVMSKILKILRDPNEQLFVREDIVAALGTAKWRKKTELRGSLTPEHLTPQEDEALNRTVASAKDILSVTQAVKQMQEVSSTTKFEGEFVRVLSEIILNKENHIELRMAAVQTLTQLTKVEVASGLFEEKNLRIAYEAIKENANNGGDASSFYSGAAAALAELRSSVKGDVLAAMDRPGRTISSTSH
jgi:hypothetical protein